jgi:cytochrome P450
LQEKLAARRRQQSTGDDVLSLLLEARTEDERPMEYDELRDQLVTLLLAGHETTSIALASCLEQIHRHPAVRQRLLDELGTGSASRSPNPEELQRATYLGATIDETLRIAPIVSDVTRRVREPFWLDDGLLLNQNDGILVLIEALHQDEELYPEPKQFRPERFLERKYTSYEYAPFGGGVRRCLGAAFSDYETRILLATILRRVTLELRRPRPDPRIRRNITMGPKYGVPMRVVSVTNR